MKLTASVVLLVSVFVLGQAPQARAGEGEPCSRATLRGNFGYTATGSLLPEYAAPPFAGPFAEVGRQSFDGNGHTTATATLSANGNILTVTIEGTYAVKANCTGRMILNVSPLGSTVRVDFVIDDAGTEVRAIGTDQGLVESRIYKKQFPEDR